MQKLFAIVPASFTVTALHKKQQVGKVPEQVLLFRACMPAKFRYNEVHMWYLVFSIRSREELIRLNPRLN